MEYIDIEIIVHVLHCSRGGGREGIDKTSFLRNDPSIFFKENLNGFK